MIKLLELYDSVQGEGPNVGRLTTFVRFAGCNYRCPGWPCDTPYSIMPEVWRHEFESVTPHELVRRILDRPTSHVCITGGEPLLQPKDDVRSLVGQLRNNSITMDLFTNGSRDLLHYHMIRPGVTVVMDWKLPGSGQGDSDLLVREEHRLQLMPGSAVKFVCVDKNDFEHAAELWESWGETSHSVYFAPAWGRLEPDELVAWMLEYGMEAACLNLQTHKYIWDPAARRI